MKKVLSIIAIALVTITAVNAQGTMEQDHKMKSDKMMKSEKMMDKVAIRTLSLEQVDGQFVQKQITVDAGTYVFNIKNNAVDHNVGFVLVKKGADVSNPKNHIKTAYVTAPVATNESQQSKPTTLAPGEYNYFCPLNPTATDNLLIVR